jgi:hypothetical protein
MKSSLISQSKTTPTKNEKENKAKQSLLGLFRNKRGSDKVTPKASDIQSRNNVFDFKNMSDNKDNINSNVNTPKGSIDGGNSNKSGGNRGTGAVSEEH